MGSTIVGMQYMSSRESARTIISEIVLSEEENDELSGEMMVPTNAALLDEDEIHRPLSPATPFESFFMSPHLQTHHISANALASQIRGANARSNYSGGHSLTSVATDEFGTACDEPNTQEEPEKNIWGSSLFGKDVLIISREPIPEVSFEYEDASIMSTTSSTTDEPHYDVAEHIYEGVKGAWAWGKGIPVFSPFMGIAEAVSNKVLGVAGTSLQGLDAEITPKLADIDTSLLNPAIAKIVGVLMTTASKGEDTFAPLINTILGAAGVDKIEDKKTPTETAPEVTPDAITASPAKGSGRMSYVK